MFGLVDDFPRDLGEFERRFATDEACRRYLAQRRWPAGFRCPRCDQQKAWPARGGSLWHCAACGHQTSVTAGTIFQDTRTPLTTWFRAMWWVTSQKTGVSALGLQRVLGLRSYKTAWTWLHKLRRAMVRPGRDRLTGYVEADETYIGGVHPGRVRGGRRTDTKALVAVAVEVDGRRMGRIRLRRIPDASGASLIAFIQVLPLTGKRVNLDRHAWELPRAMSWRGGLSARARPRVSDRTRLRWQ